MDPGFDSTYEGLKRQRRGELPAAGSRSDSTYEGLKLLARGDYVAAGSVLTVPMRA